MNRDLAHRLSVLLAASTFLLIFAGGLVTSTGSGLAVPDWPLSFGQVFPRMEGGVLYEHGHRMIATAVGIITIGAAVAIQMADPRGWVRLLGWLALAAVVVQGVLGGVTVLMRLPTAVSVAHAGVAQLFFAITVTLAVITSARWRGVPRLTGGDATLSTTRSLALATLAATYVQTLLGAVVRHTGAGLAIPDFPLSFGRLVPRFTTDLVAYNFAHRAGAAVVLVLAAWTVWHVLRNHAGRPEVRRPALLLGVVVAVQVLLGALAVWTRRAVTPTTAHVATGALLLVTALVLVLRTYLAPMAEPQRMTAGSGEFAGSQP